MTSDATHTFLGCYADYTGQVRDMDGFEPDGLSGEPAERVAQCHAHCAAAGYAFMGMQHSNQCFCDNGFGSQGERDISTCNSSPEVGDFADQCGLGVTTEDGSEYMCGGANAVYSVVSVLHGGRWQAARPTAGAVLRRPPPWRVTGRPHLAAICSMPS